MAGLVVYPREEGETHNNISHKITRTPHNTHICMAHAFRRTIKKRRRSYLVKLVVCQKESSENTQNFPPIERNGDLDKHMMVFFCQNKWVSLKGIHIGWMQDVGFMCFFLPI